jgi:hypothetical protein
MWANTILKFTRDRQSDSGKCSALPELAATSTFRAWA